MSTRFTSRLVPLLLAGTLFATSCSALLEDEQTVDGDGSGSSSGGLAGGVTDLSTDDIILTSGLRTVADCAALLEQIKDEAIERVGPYGFDQGGWFFGPEVAIGEETDVAMEDSEAASDAQAAPAASPTTTTQAFDRAESSNLAGDDSAAEATADAAGGGADGDFSGTNNQEVDVDEADLVKTDGRRLVIASGNTLRVIDVTAATPRLVDTIELPEDAWGGQMFLDGDRVLLMTSGWTNEPFNDVAPAAPVNWFPGSPIGRLVEVDLNDGAIVRTLEFEGGYLSAREIDGSIRIVLTAAANRFAFVYPSNAGAEESAEKANRDLIENSTIEQWIPTFRLTEGRDVVAEGPIVDCDRVHLPNEFAGFGSMVLLTVDLADGLSVQDAVSVFTDAQTMYASTDRVAIATPRWPELDENGNPDSEEFNTALHTFDITDPDRAGYVASGLVDGTLLNQFSLSEYEGRLRVATTAGSPWGAESSESFVSILEEQDGVLQVVGQVGGLGRGEQIFSVRFMGDTAYVVTFRQVDPLYTVDLSDPRNPEVKGELKIPGFSDYLHPVGEDHLIGVGMDGDEDGRVEGAVMSLFDVSDLANPTRTAKLPLGPKFEVEQFEDGGEGVEAGSYTPVSHDAKAFTYWDDVAIVPVSWWRYRWDGQGGSDESNGSDAVLVAVDPAGELTELGRVSHPATSECDDYYLEEELRAEEEAALEAEEGGLFDDDANSEAEDEPDSESGDAEAGFVDGPPEEEPPATTIPGPSERYCYTWTPEIQRSIIIGDDLYTLSDGGVLVNGFDGLDEITWIPFERP